MSEYKQYVTAVNKIFEYLAKMKAGWNNLDNINYIESIEEYKEVIINAANYFKSENKKDSKVNNTTQELEELGE
ncbi:MAG: hypothetical protein IKE70_04370 [Bacilli bacterium]|nr:hypothetical protein [Bacilli bacterium]